MLPTRHRRLRRIVMNPPQSFIDSSAAINPVTPGGLSSNPIVIGQGGQAVMVAPGASAASPVGNEQAQATAQAVSDALTGTSTASAVLTSSAVTTESSESITPATTGSTTAPVGSTAATPTTQAVTSISIEQTSASTSSTATSSASLSIMSTSAASSLVTLTISATSSLSSASTSSSISSKSLLSTTSSTASSSVTSSATISASAAAATTAPHHFTHSALFIFLLLLGILVAVALVATSVSWLIRRSLLPCCAHNDIDYDGLADLVQSFHAPSRSSTLRRTNSSDPEKALQRRSSLFASDPGRSPFLHSGMQEMHWDSNTSKIAVPVAAHLYGETGPLEVRNAVPGDIGMEGEQERGYEEHGTPRESVAGGTPRFLSVDGDGLEVPWSRQSSRDHDFSALGFRPHPAHDLSSPYLSPPDARDYFGPPFPSPPATIDEQDQPQRAGTWASNLRISLFAAISGARGQTPIPEDRFTRQVLPLHRDSTRRQAFPIISEEKDAEMIGSVFLAPSLSTDSAMTLPQRPQRLPLRGSAGERYKRYARSQRSNDQDDESCASWSSVEDVRLPSRLAGGERARGVKG